MHKGWIFGDLLITTCIQGCGAPLIDPCFSHSEHGAFNGWCLYGKPWILRDRRSPARSLVIAWRSKTPNGHVAMSTGTETRPLGCVVKADAGEEG